MKLNTTASNPKMSDNRDVMELVKTILDELERIEEGDIRGGAGRTIIREEVTEDNQSFELGMLDRFIQAGKDLDVHLSNGRWISPDEYNIDQNNVLTFVNQQAICKKGDVIFFTPNLGRLIKESDSEYMKHLRSLWDYLHTAEVDRSTIRVKETILSNREITGMINIDSIRGNHLHNILGYTWKDMNNWAVNTDVEYNEDTDEYIMPSINQDTHTLMTMPIDKYLKPNSCYIALLDADPLYNIPFLKLFITKAVKEPYCIEIDGKESGYQTCVQVFRTGISVQNASISLGKESSDIPDESMIKYRNLRIYEISEELFNTIGTVDELSGKSLIDIFPFCQEPLTPVINPTILNTGDTTAIKEILYKNEKISFKGTDLPVLYINMLGHTSRNLLDRIDKEMHFSNKTSNLVQVDANCELGNHKSDYYSLVLTMYSLSRPDVIQYPPKLYLIFDDDFNTATYVGNLPIRMGRHALTFRTGDLKTKRLTGIMIDDGCIKSGFSVKLKNICIVSNDWGDKETPMITPYIEPNTLFSTTPIIKINDYQMRLDDRDLRSLPNGTRDELIIKGNDKTRIDRVGEVTINKGMITLLSDYITNTHIPVKLNISDMCRSTSFKEDIMCPDIPVVDIAYHQLMVVDKNTRTYIGVTIDGDVILNINVRDDLRNSSLPALYEWLVERNIKIYYKLNNPLVSTGRIEDINISTENTLDKYSMGILIPNGLTLRYNYKNPNTHSISFNASLYSGDVIYPTNLGSYRHLSNWMALHTGRFNTSKMLETPKVTSISIEVPDYIQSTNDVIACGINGEHLTNLYIDKRDGKNYIVFEIENKLVDEYGIDGIVSHKNFRLFIKREQPLITELHADGTLAITDESNTLISLSDTGVLPTYNISIPANIKGAIDTFVIHNVRHSKNLTKCKEVQEPVTNNITHNHYSCSPNYIINGSMQVWEGVSNRIVKGLRNNIPLASLFTWYNNQDANVNVLTSEYINNTMRFTIGRDDKNIVSYSEVGGTLVYSVPRDIINILKGRRLTLSLNINATFEGTVTQEIYQMVSGSSGKTTKYLELNKERKTIRFIMEEEVTLCNIKWNILFPNGITSDNYIEISDIKLEIGDEATPYHPAPYVEELNNVNKYMECVDYGLMDHMYGKVMNINGVDYTVTDYIRFISPKLTNNPTILVNYEYGESNVLGILSDRFGFRLIVQSTGVPVKIKNYTVIV